MQTNQGTPSYERRVEMVEDVQAQLGADLAAGLKALRAYDSHPSEDLRRDLLAMTWRTALKSNEPVVRQSLVNYMINVLVEGSSFLQGQAVKFLWDFRPVDFDARAKGILEKISWSGEYGSEIIRLIGIAGIRTRTAELSSVAAANWENIPLVNLYASQTWTAALALARFGDSACAERIVAMVKSEPNLITRATKLFAELGYTRHPLAFDALRTYLGSMARMERIKDNVPGLPEALYAAQQFALCVEGCPVNGPDVEEEDIPVIRAWAEAQTTWRFRI